ncbi:MAG TPA: NepR family anti-sigma factor [Beijerinckiaceae bacterium]|nr:NepR family anti-sigma factor [Beijerinckiaceae bacterium]
MKVIKSEAFLPRINAVPTIVTAAAVGRVLQRLYADTLDEPLPDDITVLLRQLDGPRC